MLCVPKPPTQGPEQNVSNLRITHVSSETVVSAGVRLQLRTMPSQDRVLYHQNRCSLIQPSNYHYQHPLSFPNMWQSPQKD